MVLLMNCPYCTHTAIKDEQYCYQDDTNLQPYHCEFCGKSFNEHTATLAARSDTQNSREQLLSKFRDEVEILREQVESLKQELCDQIQLTEECRQDMELTEQELTLVQSELRTLLMSSVRLELDQAKELARTIWKSKKSASDSLAELLSAVYDSTVNSEELKQIDELTMTTPLKRTKATTQNEYEFKVRYNEAGVRFIGFKARFVRFKAKHEGMKAKLRDI